MTAHCRLHDDRDERVAGRRRERQPLPSLPLAHRQPEPADTGRLASRRNLDRLWSGLRRGARDELPPDRPADGRRRRGRLRRLVASSSPAPDSARTCKCADAVILVQREFMTLQERYCADITAYRAARSKDLIRRGILAVLERAVFGGSVLHASVMTRPNVSNSEVGHPALHQPGKP